MEIAQDPELRKYNRLIYDLANRTQAIKYMLDGLNAGSVRLSVKIQRGKNVRKNRVRVQI